MIDHVQLKNGSTGRIVSALQASLVRRGHGIKVDGTCGPATLTAAGRELAMPGIKALGRSALNALGVPLAYGIDLSGHNEGGNKRPVDCDEVAEAGISFAWLKLTESTSYVNGEARRQAVELARRGVSVGGYHFADPSAKRPLDLGDLAADAHAEAAHYLETRSAFFKDVPTGLLLPDVLDLELQYQHKLSAIAWSAIGGTPAARAERCALWALAWLHAVEVATGRKLMIYTARWAWQAYFARAPKALRDRLMAHPLGLASYNSGAGPKRTIDGWDWMVWQFTGSGSVPGVDGKCDINVCLASDLGL